LREIEFVTPGKRDYKTERERQKHSALQAHLIAAASVVCE